MNKDYYLLDEALNTLTGVRPWVSPDYYRENILPVVNKLKERLVEIQFEKTGFNKQPIVKVSKPLTLDDFSDTIPTSFLEKPTGFGLLDEAVKTTTCKKDPRAPHKQHIELSNTMGRYVCMCEFWSP